VANTPSALAIKSFEILSVSSGGVFEDLLNMHVRLPKHGGRYGAGIGLVGEQRHTLLNAERLEDRL
jgi:hypothetical protein